MPTSAWPNPWKNAGRAALLACIAGSTIADAAGIDTRAIAAGCASCHQPAQRMPPPLEGEARAPLAAALRAFRDGTRPGTVMPQLAKGYTPAQLDAVAAYFAAQARSR
jgi:cytochrome c553